MQHLIWVRSNPAVSGESDNFWHLSSGSWGAARAAMAAKVSPLPNCVFKGWTSSPDYCAAWVITANSTSSSSSVPAAMGLLLPSSNSSRKVHILYSISVWSHRGGRKACVFRFVISACNAIIFAGLLHTLCTVLAGLVYCATLLGTSYAFSNFLCLSAKSTCSTFQFIIPPLITWSSTVTRATQSCCSDPNIAAHSAHLPVPIVCINFGGGGYWGYYNNQWNSRKLSCCCCWCCVSNSWLCSYTVMSVAIARQL